MNQNRLFRLTRIRLALYYAVVMGLILSLCAFGFYSSVFHAHVVALDNEIESIAGTIHDTIEPKLPTPGHLEPAVRQLFPNLSMCIGANCIQQQPDTKRHVVGAFDKSNYYIRFFDINGRLIATAGNYPEGISTNFNKKGLKKDLNLLAPFFLLYSELMICATIYIKSLTKNGKCDFYATALRLK